MIFVVLSGISGAGMGLSYRLRARLGLDPFWVLFFAALASVVFSAVGVLASPGDLLNGQAILLGSGHSLTMTVSIALFFYITDRARIGVSWTVIQLGVVVPFVFSIVVMGEVLSTLGLAAIGSAAVAVVLFGAARSHAHARKDKSQRDTPSVASHTGDTSLIVRYAGIALVCSSLLTGTTQIFPRIYAEYHTGSGFPLIFWSSVFMVGYSAVLLLVRRAQSSYLPVRGSLPVYVGFSALFSLARFLLVYFLLVALQSVPGAIAFPLRSVVNTGAVVIVAAVLYGEHVSRLEWLAIGFSVMAVALIAGS